MSDLALTIAFSLSSGALILIAGRGIVLYHIRKSAMMPLTASPDCLGQMKKRHCEYCSTDCPTSARCVLLVMDEYMRKHPEILSSQDSPEQL